MTNREIYASTSYWTNRVKNSNTTEDEYSILGKILNCNIHVGYLVMIFCFKEGIATVLRLKTDTVYKLAKQGKVENAQVVLNKLVGKGENLDDIPVMERSAFSIPRLNLI